MILDIHLILEQLWYFLLYIQGLGRASCWAGSEVFVTLLGLEGHVDKSGHC